MSHHFVTFSPRNLTLEGRSAWKKDIKQKIKDFRARNYNSEKEKSLLKNLFNKTQPMINNEKVSLDSSLFIGIRLQ